MRISTSWTHSRDGVLHYCYATPAQLVIGRLGEHALLYDQQPHTHQEFLSGTLNDQLKHTLGGHVVAEIRRLLRNPLRFGRELYQESLRADRLRRWWSIPYDYSLRPIAANPHERGSDNHLNWGSGVDAETLLVLGDGTELHIGYRKETNYIRPPSGDPRVVQVKNGPALTSQHHFFVVSGHLEVIDCRGNTVYSSRFYETSMGIGTRFPLVDLLRRDDRVLAVYENRDLDDPRSRAVMGESGLLLIGLEQGIVSRCKND